MNILNFDQEILYICLSNLDIISIIKCRIICKKIKEFISSKYFLDLYPQSELLSNLINNPLSARNLSICVRHRHIPLINHLMKKLNESEWHLGMEEIIMNDDLELFKLFMNRGYFPSIEHAIFLAKEKKTNITNYMFSHRDDELLNYLRRFQ